MSILTKEDIEKLERQADERDIVSKESNEEKVNETLKSDYEKSFDEIINEILGESDETENNWLTPDEEFEKNMKEIEELDVSQYADTSIEEIDNTQTYKFAGNAHMKLFNGFCFDTGLGDGYREITVLQTSSPLLIDGTFNTSEIRIEKHPNINKIGKVVFNDTQKANNLIIGNVGVCGCFDATAVSIKDNSYVDITLDISDMTRCSYLLIDTRFNKVCGKIRLTEKFYNQMTECNKKFLSKISKDKHIKITVEDTPFEKYVVPSDKIKNFTFDEMMQELNLE